MDSEPLHKLLQVFLKAMAETGQVKLYGEHPTLTETSLYRARRHIFKEERYVDYYTYCIVLISFLNENVLCIT